MKALRTIPRASGALPALYAATTTSPTPSSRPFSVLNRPPPNYEGHVPLNRIEKASLAIGAGIWSLLSPYRADLIAAVGEATATPYFIYRLRDAMLADPTGRRILRDRPRMTSTTLNLDRLRQLPDNSVGRAYVGWLDAEGVSPDTRTSVRFIDDPECAYVMQRYRECHDFYHALTGLPVVREGEVALKAFEFANTLIPMTGLATLSYVTMKTGERRRFREIYGPWAVRNGLRAKEVINVYWEEQMERDVDELRAELGIERPPNMRAIRKKEREERKKAMEKAAAGP
ncbi:Ubiquinone biosynthesis protein [Colletotrichum sp. SAR11_240]|nr:Ubiquinone biosynthesis protein [Colletotrichum sp. SAR11_240]